MDPIPVQTSYEGETIRGQIVFLTKFYIEVEITYPYIHYYSYEGMNGMARMTSFHYLVIQEKAASRLLINIYKKLSYLDQFIDPAIKVYTHLNEELKAISVIDKKKIRERIQSKLRDWFFRSYLPGISYPEEDQIERILKAYQKDGTKLYWPEVPRKETDCQTFQES